MIRTGVSLAALLGCLGLAGQTPQSPVFRGGVDHVAVDVVVTDSHDRPITDLTQADFEIVEQKRVQTIADFAFVSVPLSHRTIDLEAPPAPPRDVASNARSPQTSRAIVFVIGAVKAQDIVLLKRLMLEFLKTLSPEDQVAITYAFNSKLGQDFTNDPGRLIRAVNNTRAALGGSQGDMRDLIFGLENVITSLSSSSQARRALVYVSSSACLPDDLPPVGPKCLRMYEHAKREDVPIYTIDPHGISMAEDVNGIGGHMEDQTPDARAAQTLGIIQAQDRLRTLAEQTGGRAFVSAAAAGAASEVMTENGSYYLLGYYPDPFVRDGKFHEFKVTVKRPGARVRARSGYAAPPATAEILEPKKFLDTKLAGGMDAPGLALRGVVTPIAVTAKAMRAVVTVEVAYPTTGLKSGPIDDDLQLGIMALDPDAKLKVSSQRSLRFAATSMSGTSAVFLIDDVIDLPTEPLTVRVGVSSRALGVSGTIHLPVDVPNPARDTPQLTGLVLGVVGRRPEPAMGADRIADLVPFQPTTSREFSAADTLRVFARVVWAGKSDQPAVTLRLEGPVSIAPRQVPITVAAVPRGPHQAVIDTTLPLKDLKSGDYVLIVDATAAGDRQSTRAVPFTIVGSPLAASR